MKRVGTPALILAVLILLASLWAGAGLSVRVKADNYEVKTAAAERMQRCMDAVKGYKAELGIPLSEEDVLETGMIGDTFTGMTTTVGVVDAKRTAATTDMAAAAVDMLEKAGLKRGSVAGAAFSGSFPGWNLAVLSAAEEMGVRLVYTASAGASMYGANQPELTFLDMLLRLLDDGLLSERPALFSLGGDWDCGMEMFDEEHDMLFERFNNGFVPFLYEQDYEKNVAYRLALYEELGPIDCFIGVGGNVTTIGRGEDTLPPGVIRPGAVTETDAESGLLEIYNTRGIPVIHLLNIKQLAADYGVPYDPETQSVIGEGAVYYETLPPKLIPLAGLVLAAAVLLADRLLKRKREAAHA